MNKLDLSRGFPALSKPAPFADSAIAEEGRKPLPNALTSYDLLKAVAVVIMVIDHLGYYFFPENLWWRAVGRTGFPVWFFLIGHASGRDIPRKLWGGALILVMADMIVGRSLFALNALFTIMAIRLCIDPVMAFLLKNRFNLIAGCVLLVLLVFPTAAVAEYGTLGLITAIYGYMVRHKDRIANKELVFYYMIFAFLIFAVYQQIMFGFSQEQFVVMAAGTLLCRFYLLGFKSEVYPKLTAAIPAFVTQSMQFCGRKTLEIYIVHLLVFKALALAFGMPGFSLFGFDLFGNLQKAFAGLLF